MDSTMLLDNGDGTSSLPDGTVFENKCLTEHDPVCVGDQFVFHWDNQEICDAYGYGEINNTIVTIAYIHSISSGYFSLEEFILPSHTGQNEIPPKERWVFPRAVLHRIISRKEVDLSGFNEIFT